jgi:glycosyltransferase involved in cell wall biosynthesis
METTIIIPTRNEVLSVGNTLRRLLALGLENCEIIVVDGASSDGTVEAAEKYPCRVVYQAASQLGKGMGLRMGFIHALGDKVIWTDADDTYPVEMIPRMVEELDNYDIVVCSRKYGKENMPKFNRFGNWLFKVLIQKLHGFKGNDPCTGLYGVRKEHLLSMRLTSTHFAIEPEISIKAGRMKLKTLDIPITYTPRAGDTKLNPIRVGFEDMWTIIKLIGWKPK